MNLRKASHKTKTDNDPALKKFRDKLQSISEGTLSKIRLMGDKAESYPPTISEDEEEIANAKTA